MNLRQARRSALQVKLDHLGRAGAHKEQHLDVRPPLQQAVHHLVELAIELGAAREITLIDDGGGESRLGEDHHTRRGLDQMRAGARAHDEEEGILDLPVQPDDSGQATEHLALSALAQNRRIGAAIALRGGAEGNVHDWASICSRAARSFSRNCAALMT